MHKETGAQAGTNQGLPGGLVDALASTFTERGESLLEVADRGTVLLVFLRHFGCSYCRQALSDVAAIQSDLALKNVQPVFVHLGSPERARPYFDYYGLAEVDRISDPEASLYTSSTFTLRRVNPFFHFLLPAVWKGWLLGGIRRYGIGFIREDSYQMPGVFVLRGRAIYSFFRYKTIADQPDYLALLP